MTFNDLRSGRSRIRAGGCWESVMKRSGRKERRREERKERGEERKKGGKERKEVREEKKERESRERERESRGNCFKEKKLHRHSLRE